MLTVNGLYGHVARNNMRSVWMFLGFIIAYQLVGAALLTLPLLFFDIRNFPFTSPINYFVNYGWIVMILSALAFAYRYRRHMKSLQDELGFDYVTVMQNPRLIRIVDRVARTAGIDMPKVAILPVDALNAFACGIKANSATVVVTEGLLRALNDDELEAVIAHEVTHILNGDIRSMAFANVSISSLMRLARFNLLRMKEGWGRAIFGILFPPLFFLSMASGLVMHLAMTVAKVTRLLIASSREYVADAEAVRLTHKPAALISALRKIEGRSDVPGLDPIADAMMIDGATIGEFATHPTIAERIKMLQRHAGSMAHVASDFEPGESAFQAARDAIRPAGGAAGLFGMSGGAFGRKLPPTDASAKANAAKPAPGNLINRVNVGNDQNIFGVSKGMKQKMKIVGFVFIGLMLFSSWNMQRTFSNMNSVEKNLSGKTNTKSVSSREKSGSGTKTRQTAITPLESSDAIPKFSERTIEPTSKPVAKPSRPGVGEVANGVVTIVKTRIDAKQRFEAIGKIMPQARDGEKPTKREPTAEEIELQRQILEGGSKTGKAKFTPIAGSMVRKEAEGWSLR